MYPRNDIGTISCENGTSNVRKKKKEPPNVTKILSNVMLKLHNMDGIVKYEKK